MINNDTNCSKTSRNSAGCHGVTFSKDICTLCNISDVDISDVYIVIPVEMRLLGSVADIKEEHSSNA